MKGIEETLFHRSEITFDLNILKNRLFSTMNHLINCATETSSEWQALKERCCTLLLGSVLLEVSKDFIPAFFVCLSRTTKAVFTQIL